MKKVKIKAKLIGEEEYSYEGIGSYDKKKKALTYQDDFAKITLYLKDKIMVRENEESILSYKFQEGKESRFEVYSKELKKTGVLTLITKEIKIEEGLFQVIYQLEGNSFFHHYIVNWRD